nr:sensor histidine kinase [Gammaproteobacteria bacterium]
GRFEKLVEPADLSVRFDPGQLHQVVRNLAENALHHSGEDEKIQLHGGIRTETQRPYLDVIDRGSGVSAEVAEQIFEPFYTTRGDGTGLGLYIAKELCEANRASLNLLASDQGCRFRITFADPRRQGGVAQ